MGTLVLVATPIGNLDDMSPRAIDALRTASLICCEDTRRTGKLISHFHLGGVRMLVTNEHTEHQRTQDVVDVLTGGGTVAVVTDAGTPGISDPGERLVRAAIDDGHTVTAIPGPAAGVMALVISGLPTARHVFEGFLPRSGPSRASRLAEIATERRTVVLYEAPHRMERTLGDLRGACGADRRVAVARELTKVHEDVWRGTLAGAVEWIRERDAQGEFVIVIEGATPPAGPDDDQIRLRLGDELAAGASRKSAVSTVAAELAVPRNRVYDLALTLPASRTPATE